MTRRHRRFENALLLLGVLLLGSCGGDDACAPTDPGCRPAGQAALEIVTPNVDDRALVVTIHGEFTAAHASPGYRIFASADQQTLIVVSSGNMARSGRPLTIDIPDVSQLGAYQATISEAAGSDYQVRSDLSAYRAAFVPAGN